MKKCPAAGDLVVCTNDVYNKIIPITCEWPPQYVGALCRVIEVRPRYITVQAISKDLVQYRNTFGNNPTFDGDPEGFYYLNTISLNNKLLKLIL